MAADTRLPGYASLLADYHRAYAGPLREMIDVLPLGEGDRVLEVACGDGFYARQLASRVGRSGLVVATDILPAFLEEAVRPDDTRARFAAAALERLPFRAGTFDLVWCAQSLYSLPEPVDAVRRMRGAARPGGVVAVLENDTLHHVLLPWPVEVELAVRQAELCGFIAESDRPRKFYVGRQLREVFHAAGLERVHQRTWATSHHAPLGPDLRGFLEKDLANLRDRARPYLDPALRAGFDRLTEPGSNAYILDGPDLTVTCLNHVAWGYRPEP